MRRDSENSSVDGNEAGLPPIQVRLHASMRDIDAAQWDALVETSPSATPFMRWAYFDALHASRSARAQTGWAPQFLTVRRDGSDELLGACPLYLKSHSYGEYVFDWAWADAYERAGLAYYPKLLNAVPFTPVPGPRLLARDNDARQLILAALVALVAQEKLSSAHLLFIDEADAQAAREAGWLMRSSVQFHWRNREPQPHSDFAEFLSTLQREKRKKIQQERRYVREEGVQFEVREGAQITQGDWDFFHRCYCATYRAHHSTPYLTRDFFARMAQTMPRNWLMFTALRGGERIACSLLAIDPERGHAFGRYWGALETVRCLHFEACYYQPLQWCIEHGYARFEGGAQGEHKMARGLMPVQTWSAHWLADARFADAVARFLDREGAGVEAYVDELRERNPFKSDAP
jgi:predicted N-acyltransferase